MIAPGRSRSLSRRRFLALSVVGLGGVSLAACAGGASAPATPTQGGTAPVATQAAAPTQAAAQATAAPAPAATTAPAAAATSAPAATPSAAVTAAAQPTSAATLAPVNLTYVIWNAGNSKDVQVVQDAVNAMLKPKLNATLTLKIVQDITAQAPLLLSSGSPLDLITISTFDPFPVQVGTGGLRELDDLLPKYAPKLWSEIPQSIWQAAKVGGKIYMAINQAGWVSYAGMWARQDLIDKYKFDWQSTKKVEDWEPYFDQILKGEPGVTPVISSDTYHGWLWYPSYWGVDPVDVGIGPQYGKGLIGVRVNDKSRKVFSVAESPEYKQSCEIARRWHQKGYFSKDLPTDADMGTKRSALKYAVFWFWAVGPFSTKEMGQAEWHGATILTKPLQDKAILTTGQIQGQGIAVGKVSKNPERAVMYIEEVNHNADLYNTLNYGVEGKHWVWVDKSKKLISPPPGVTPETNGWNSNTFWQFGDRHLLYLTDPADIGVWDRIDAATKDAIQSPVLGFNVDRKPIQNEIAQVASVGKEYGLPLNKGLVDVGDSSRGLDKFIAQLKTAGIDKIVAEVQRQVDAWASSQSK